MGCVLHNPPFQKEGVGESTTQPTYSGGRGEGGRDGGDVLHNPPIQKGGVVEEGVGEGGVG